MPTRAFLFPGFGATVPYVTKTLQPGNYTLGLEGGDVGGEIYVFGDSNRARPTTSATFTRATVAYKQDGTQVASGQPRYETGRHGQAITVEESTTNLLTANQSSIETDTSGWVGVGSNIARTTSDAFVDTACLEVTLPSSSYAGAQLTPYFAVTAGTSYTWSYYIKAVSAPPNGMQAVIGWRDSSNAIISYSVTPLTAIATSWNRVAVSGVAPTGAVQAQVYLQKGDNTDTGVVRIDAAQFEAKNYATTWQVGGINRNAETLVIPDVIPTTGTLEWWWQAPTNITRDTTAGQYRDLVVMQIGNYYGNSSLSMWISNAGVMQTYIKGQSNTGWSATGSFNTGLTEAQQRTPHHFAITFTGGTDFRFYMDGVLLRGPVSIADPVTDWAGTSHNLVGAGSRQTAIIDDVRVSSTVRTASDLVAVAGSSSPSPIDASTVYKLDLDGTLVAKRYEAYRFADRATQNLDLVFDLVEPAMLHFRPIRRPGIATLKQDWPRSSYVGGMGSIVPVGSYWREGFSRLNAEGNTSAFGRRDVTGTARYSAVTLIRPTGTREVRLLATIAGITSTIMRAVTYRDIGVILIQKTPPYRVVIADRLGAAIDEVPFTSLSFSYLLNEAGSVEFGLPLVHEKVTRDLIAPGERRIQVYRNGKLEWQGFLWQVDVDVSSGNLRVGGSDLFSVLERRHIDQTLIYENEKQEDIAWKLIDFTQNKGWGDLGITRAAGRPTNKVRTVRYQEWERIKVADAIKDLSALKGGFDFDITPDAKFETYSIKGTNSDVHLELGKNIVNLSYTADASNTVSRISALGHGEGRNRCWVDVTDETVRATHGLLEDSIERPKIKHYDMLADRAEEELNSRKKTMLLPTISVVTDDPPFGAFELGDKLMVKAGLGYASLNQRFRLTGMEVSLGDEGREVMNLVFDERTEVEV